MDARLETCLSLFVPGDTGADIGTDHGLLPCAILQRNLCRQMIFSDISPSALDHARHQVRRLALEERAVFRLSDGLDALDRPVCCISITGMGGTHMAELLTRNPRHLNQTPLVLCAHSDVPVIRRAILRIGYHFTREVLTRDRGRFYIVMRAEYGHAAQDEDELDFGSLMYHQPSGDLLPYLRRQIQILETQERELSRSAMPREEETERIRHALDFYRKKEALL